MALNNGGERGRMKGKRVNDIDGMFIPAVDEAGRLPAEFDCICAR